MLRLQIRVAEHPARPARPSEQDVTLGIAPVDWKPLRNFTSSAPNKVRNVMIALHKANALTTAALRSFESCITPVASLLARQRRSGLEPREIPGCSEACNSVSASAWPQ